MDKGLAKNSLSSLGDNLRHRYEDAFVRNEVTNLRQQVNVLHDTLLAFITKVDSRLASYDENQKRINSRLTRLERKYDVKSTTADSFSRVRSSALTGTVVSGETSVVASGAERGETSSYPVVDEHGNLTQFVATIAKEPSSSVNLEGALVVAAEVLPKEEDDEADMDEVISEEEDMESTGKVSESGVNSSGTMPGPLTRSSLRPRASSARNTVLGRRDKAAHPGALDWEQIEAEAKVMIDLPERKGKGGKVSGRLGAGSPAWTHYLRTAIQRSIGEEAMIRYAREGSKVFKGEQEEVFNDVKDHVVDFCRKYEVLPPEDKLMDEIAWAFLRNKKRYRAK